MNNDNGFDIIIYVFFFVITQLGVFGPNAQDLLIPFLLGERETLQ